MKNIKYKNLLKLLNSIKAEMNMNLKHMMQTIKNGGLLLPTGAVISCTNSFSRFYYCIKGYAADGSDLKEYERFTS